MFDRMLQWLRQTVLRLFGQGDTALTISPVMQGLIAKWAAMYGGDEGKDGCGLGLAQFVAGEFARLVTLESEIRLEGARGEWMDAQLPAFRRGLRAAVEYACALGGAVFRPYVSGDGIQVDVVTADCFFPIAFDSAGRLTGAIFVQQITRGGTIFTRLEQHIYENGAETVKNKAFSSSTSASLGGQVPLASVPEWADIAPEAAIEGLDRPLFAYFKIPLANNRDKASPLGISVFANAEQSIRQANAQYGRLLWEYDGGQLAIDVDEAAIRTNLDGTPVMDERGQRLYRRGLNMTGNLYQAFAPALRDSSYRAGLNDIFRRIEMQCSLSFGTISDPQAVEKTATEVRMAKQRSYAAVCDIQSALQYALDDLFYAMDKLAQLYGLGPAGQWQATYVWHDSVLTDEETARAVDKDDALNGFIPKWRYNVDWRGMTEEEARAAVEEAAGEGSGDVLTFGGNG